MADSFNKKEREKKRRKKRQDKQDKKQQRKLEDNSPPEFMYVGADGNLTPNPPDPGNRKKVSLEEIEISTPKKTETEESKFTKEGFVKLYNPEKRYGFIRDSKSGDDYFVHADNTVEQIKERDKVLFDVGSGPKGPIAINVRLNNKEKAAAPEVKAEVPETKEQEQPES